MQIQPVFVWLWQKVIPRLGVHYGQGPSPTDDCAVLVHISLIHILCSFSGKLSAKFSMGCVVIWFLYFPHWSILIYYRVTDLFININKLLNRITKSIIVPYFNTCIKAQSRGVYRLWWCTWHYTTNWWHPTGSLTTTTSRRHSKSFAGDCLNLNLSFLSSAGKFLPQAHPLVFVSLNITPYIRRHDYYKMGTPLHINKYSPSSTKKIDFLTLHLLCYRIIARKIATIT